MKRRLSIIGPDRKWTLFWVALFGKTVLLIFLFQLHGVQWNGPWYALGGDSSGYINPVESLVRGEGYDPDYRMPGYAFIYLLLRLFLESQATQNALVIIQLIADSLSVVLIADIGWRTTRSLRVHQLTFWTALIAIYVTFYDRYILTETLTTFALTAGLHQFVVHLSSHKVRHLLIAGCLLAWAGFMRPAYLPLVPVSCLGIIAIKGISMRDRLVRATCLALPIIFTDGLWIIRNFSEHGEFRPTTGTVWLPDIRDGIRYPVIRMMQAFGCNYVWWDGDATIRWFNIREEGPDAVFVEDRMAPIPDRVFTESYDLDSLGMIRDDVARWYAATDTIERAGVLARVTERCDRYIASFAREKPFQYHVVSRLELLRIFVIDSGTAALMPRPMHLLSWWEKGIKVLYSGLYLVVMLLGLAGAVVALWGHRFAGALRVVPIAFLYGVLAFPFLVRMCENRYLVVVYPLAILFTVYLIDGLLFRMKGRKTTRPSAQPLQYPHSRNTYPAR